MRKEHGPPWYRQESVVMQSQVKGERPPNQIITVGTFTYPLRTPRIKFITKKAPMMTIEMK
jgi:hypothetical protein